MFIGPVLPLSARVISPSLQISFSMQTGFDGGAETSANHAAMPCHGMTQRSEQMLCFTHCLQYLNSIAVLSERFAIPYEDSGGNESRDTISLFIQPSSHLLIDANLSRAPPDLGPLRLSGKGLSFLLERTSRIRF